MKTVMTKEQKEFIIKNYPTKDAKEIAKVLGVEPIKVYKFAASKGIKKQTVRSDSKTSDEQREFILNNYATMSNKEISYHTNLDVRTIQEYARLNGVKKNKAFCDRYGLSYEKKKFIIKNSKDMTAAEIGEKLKVSTHTITKFCRSAELELKSFDGIKMGGSLTIEQKRFILKNYKSMTNADICRELNVSYEQLHSYASSSKLNKDIEFCHNKPNYIEKLLEKRNDGEYDVSNYIETVDESKSNVLYKSKYGKYELNQNYFNVIDNEFKAYWLGFLYADGCVRLKDSKGKSQNNLSLTLASVDVGHIEKFKKSIQATHRIEHKIVGNKYHSDRITVTNAMICEDLNKLGCTPRKSLTLKFPTEEQVPSNLIRHFIRGYFDGDGCIHVNIENRKVSASFIGTMDFLTSLQNVLCNELKITKTKIQTREGNNALSVMWGDIHSVEKIYKYLYKDCNVYLERKLKKFDILYCLD